MNSRITRYAREDQERKELEEHCDKLILKLRRGRNWFDAKDFMALCRYYEDNENRRAIYLERGSFEITGGIEIIRASWHANDKWLSASEMAEIVGRSRQHIAKLLADAEISFKWRGREKLYNYTELRSIFESERK